MEARQILREKLARVKKESLEKRVSELEALVRQLQAGGLPVPTVEIVERIKPEGQNWWEER